VFKIKSFLKHFNSPWISWIPSVTRAHDGVHDGQQLVHAGYQPYWVARAYLLARVGQAAQALGLTALPALRSYL
jgi:hypothetical protein